MKKRFAFFAFLCFSAVCLISGGGVLTSCKHETSKPGPDIGDEDDLNEDDPGKDDPNEDDGSNDDAELDLIMYVDSKNENENTERSLSYVVGDENQKAPYFYVQSKNYPDKNQIELDSAVYSQGEDDEEELDPDEDIAVAYKKAQKNYKITLHKMPTEPGSYVFTLSFSADNGQESDLEFTLEVSKKIVSGGTEVEIKGAAPKITEGLEGGVGTDSFELKVVATVADGTTPTYQWYKDGEKIDGATNSSYKAKESGAYYVKVSANNQTVQSNTVNVVIDSSINPSDPSTVVTIPKITINTVEPYEIKDFTLKVPEASDGTLRVSVDLDVESYQWRRVEETSGNDVDVTGETNQTFIPSTFAGYYCEVVVDGRKYNSSTVKVIEKDIVMTLNKSFGNDTYIYTMLLVTPTTDVPCNFAYQWYKVEDETSGNSDPIPGATQADYMPTQEGWYECKVTPTSIATGTKGVARITDKVRVRQQNTTGEREDPVVPTVNAITGSTSLKEGEKLTLSVTATASNGTLSYQWMKGNNPISGATEKTYEKSNVTTDDAGNYTCVVTNTLNGMSIDEVAVPVTVTVTKADSTSGNVGGSFDFN